MILLIAISAGWDNPFHRAGEIAIRRIALADPPAGMALTPGHDCKKSDCDCALHG